MYGRRSDALHMYIWVRRIQASASASASQTLCAREREREKEKEREREKERGHEREVIGRIEGGGREGFRG